MPGYPVFRFTASRSPLPTRNDTDRDAATATLAHAERPEPHQLHRLVPRQRAGDRFERGPQGT